MSKFVVTKTGIQCRSHHQKYEAKHKFPHKIISEEKEKCDSELYKSLKEKVSLRLLTFDQHPQEESLNKSVKC